VGFLERLVSANAQLIAEKLREVAEQLDHAAPGPPAFASAGWVTEVFPGQEVQIEMGEIRIKDTDAPVTGTVTFTDIHGHPTAPDDVPEWSSSDESVATVTASDDGLSGAVAPVGPGEAIIACDSTDTDGTEIHSVGTVIVEAGEAVTGEITFEAAAPPEPAPEPTA
jgi:hypothetical protein